MAEQKIWKPTKRQDDFLSLPDSIFEALYGGAAGGGKSETLLMLPIAREFYKNANFKGLILRRTYPELERELILRSQEYYRATGGDYNESKRRWKWPAYGSYIQFGYAEHERDVRRYDTDEYNYIAFDELTSFTEFQYKYIAYSRCRSKRGSNLPAIVRAGTNPGNVGHGWVRKHFVEKAPDGYVILKDKGTCRIYIPAKATDNPYIDPNYVVRLQLLPIAERLAKLEGDWWTFTGQVFDDWRVEPFPDEPENARHVIEPFSIPEHWPRIIGLDWGFTAMLWGGFGAVSPDKRLYLYREYVSRGEKISTWATNIGKLAELDGNIVEVALDPSAWHNRGDPQTIAEQFQQYSGLTPSRADNDRLGGKVLMQEYLRWKSALIGNVLPAEQYDNEKAEWTRRNKGTKAYEAYVNQFIPVEERRVLPILQVFDTCEEFKKMIPLCVYNDPNKIGANKEDVAEFEGDDPYDGGRYLIKAAARYMSGVNREAVKRDEVDKICRQYDKSKDLTSFYIKMGNLEARRHLGRRRGGRRRYVPRSFGRVF